MKIHKEGRKIIMLNAIISMSIALLAWVFIAHWWIWLPIVAAMLFLACFTVWFFRQPNRKPATTDPAIIYAPADGEVVAIEEVYESEYFKDERIQISIFMSIWNVHMNWYPTPGEIKYYKYHPGKFLVAWHPKSSSDNERTTTVVDNGQHQILFRQIAGFVARRIVNYAIPGSIAQQNQNFGFIKFGSRVDILLPLGTHVNVKIGDTTCGTQTPIARLPRCK